MAKAFLSLKQNLLLAKFMHECFVALALPDRLLQNMLQKNWASR
jgi:hypothetical protein